MPRPPSARYTPALVAIHRVRIPGYGRDLSRPCKYPLRLAQRRHAGLQDLTHAGIRGRTIAAWPVPCERIVPPLRMQDILDIMQDICYIASQETTPA